MEPASAPEPEPEPERDDDDRKRRDQQDRDWYASWRAGDKHAGDQLVKRYFPRLRFYFRVRALGDHEELVQDTFVRLLEKYESYRNGSFRAFLFGIARFVFLEYLQRRHRRQAIDPYTDSLEDIAGAGFSTALTRREHYRILLDALRRLSLDDQELLELRYWQGLKTREIAEILSIHQPTLRGRLSAARRKLLKRYLEVAGVPHDITYSDGEVEQWMRQLYEALRRDEDPD